MAEACAGGPRLGLCAARRAACGAVFFAAAPVLGRETLSRALLLAYRLGQSLGSVPPARSDPLKRPAKLLPRLADFY